MQKKWFRLLFRRRVFVIFLLLLQVALMVTTIYSSSQTYQWIYNCLSLLSVFVVLHVISRAKRAPYKLLWSVVLLAFPLFGGLMYLMVRYQGLTMAFKKQIKRAETALAPCLIQSSSVKEAFLQEHPEHGKQCRYLTESCGFPVYHNISATYLSPGEEKFKAMLTALEQAERFIFLEYFIIEEGRMWNSILDILKRKAKEGVDVRLIYDDLGCFLLLPHNYEKILANMGIRCVVFNKFRPALSTLQNHRDHRKIAVIDGKWAFCGGVNLADEYINEKVRFGHWKDASVELTGPAVDSYTYMFLTLWQALTGEKTDMTDYLAPKSSCDGADGYVIPYCDSPVDDEYVSEKVYLNVISDAKQYLYIQTPYLIIDDSMVSALTLAAKSGVDVRILVPGIPDKRYVYITTQSYYRELLEGGVKIYEYTPGFLHSKVMVADDAVATVGTVNLDYRSLYLHFECGAWLCSTQAICDIRADFEKTLTVSREVTPKDCKSGFFRSILQSIFRLLAPLM
ncbi:MAG: cardiolipin synthase [Ruminococcaceae bacterium]|nr:cardiolipin synthase [Oscillospiraceae bacterium]